MGEQKTLIVNMTRFVSITLISVIVIGFIGFVYFENSRMASLQANMTTIEYSTAFEITVGNVYEIRGATVVNDEYLIPYSLSKEGQDFLLYQVAKSGDFLQKAPNSEMIILTRGGESTSYKYHFE